MDNRKLDDLEQALDRRFERGVLDAFDSGMDATHLLSVAEDLFEYIKEVRRSMRGAPSGMVAIPLVGGEE